MSDVDQFLELFVAAVDFQTAVPMTADTLLKDLPEWDSLAALGVIVMCDGEYGVSVTGEDLKNCLRIEDIFSRVKMKKAA